ncbi:hypothetical protein KY290_001699 [Solanum tuberosum]|uniref:Uncharacterized protein n=1 Tax=Solanum tuberosum TaxID=4113 RepID=A0ABQ7WPC0_SOLTU|nr:hypothetical protein KY284_001734 [Solanum tuberosum]KAH0782101.1 hypothetical protein KY290_001699 [Solanum tuberosum]
MAKWELNHLPEGVELHEIWYLHANGINGRPNKLQIISLKTDERSNNLPSGVKGEIKNSGLECHLIRSEYSKCYAVIKEQAAPSC